MCMYIFVKQYVFIVLTYSMFLIFVAAVIVVFYFLNYLNATLKFSS